MIATLPEIFIDWNEKGSDPILGYDPLQRTRMVDFHYCPITAPPGSGNG
jgi:hypothetical protein